MYRENSFLFSAKLKWLFNNLWFWGNQRQTDTWYIHYYILRYVHTFEGTSEETCCSSYVISNWYHKRISYPSKLICYYIDECKEESTFKSFECLCHSRCSCRWNALILPWGISQVSWVSNFSAKMRWKTLYYVLLEAIFDLLHLGSYILHILHKIQGYKKVMS